MAISRGREKPASGLARSPAATGQSGMVEGGEEVSGRGGKAQVGAENRLRSAGRSGTALPLAGIRRRWMSQLWRDRVAGWTLSR